MLLVYRERELTRKILMLKRELSGNYTKELYWSFKRIMGLGVCVGLELISTADASRVTLLFYVLTLQPWYLQIQQWHWSPGTQIGVKPSSKLALLFSDKDHRRVKVRGILPSTDQAQSLQAPMILQHG